MVGQAEIQHGKTWSWIAGDNEPEYPEQLAQVSHNVFAYFTLVFDDTIRYLVSEQ